MAPQIQVTGIVLAGGMSRRLGRNKALEPVGGQLLIDRVTGQLSQIAQQTVVVVNDAQRESELNLPDTCKVVIDAYQGKGSLGGIFTGLSASDGEWGIVVACDMPFLNIRLFNHMLSQTQGCDAVVPVLDGRPEPIHAIYSKKCLPFIKSKINNNDLKISRFFDEIDVKFIPEENIISLDPGLLSFFNVNTQEDLDRATALAMEGR